MIEEISTPQYNPQEDDGKNGYKAVENLHKRSGGTGEGELQGGCLDRLG